MQAKQDADDLMQQVKAAKEQIADIEAEAKRIALERDAALMPIGNLVHDSVPVDYDEVGMLSCILPSKFHWKSSHQSTCMIFVGQCAYNVLLRCSVCDTDWHRRTAGLQHVEHTAASCATHVAASAAFPPICTAHMLSSSQANNVVVKECGKFEKAEHHRYNHVDLVGLLDIVDLAQGATVAGGRGYFLKGAAVLLNQALINFALQHAVKRGSEPIQTPFFMCKSIMAECAQLKEFDEALYHVRTLKACSTWFLVLYMCAIRCIAPAALLRFSDQTCALLHGQGTTCCRVCAGDRRGRGQVLDSNI